MSKKIIHDMPEDLLIELAMGAKGDDVVQKLNEASKFIYDLGIKHGDAKIPAQLVYHTYKLWKGWDNKKQSKGLFFKDFRTYFTQHRTTDGICYLLNPKPFDLSKDTYFLYRSEVRYEKAQRSKKKKVPPG
jgi:hypothetical protein